MDLPTIAAIVIVIVIASALVGLEGLLAHHLIEKHGKRSGTVRYIAAIWLLSATFTSGFTALVNALH